MLIRKNYVLFVIAGTLLFVTSLAFFLKKPLEKRHIFTFAMIGSEKLITEVRYLSNEPAQGAIQLYVDELLLGPQTQRARPLFSLGTKTDFCFLRDKTLYIGLTKSVLYQTSSAMDIVNGIELFKTNLLHNFKSISQIELFIDNRPVE